MNTFLRGDEKKDIISCVKKGDLKRLEELIAEKDLNKSFLVDENSTILGEDEYTGTTVLKLAVNLGKKRVVQFLLKKGAKNIPDFNCSLDSDSGLHLTPLDEAVIDKSFEIAILIEKYPGCFAGKYSKLVPQKWIVEYKKWKKERKESVMKKKQDLLEEMMGNLGLNKEFETPNSSLDYERESDYYASEDED